MFSIYSMFFVVITLLYLSGSGNKIPKVNVRWDVVFIIIAIILLFTAPEGFDKKMYRNIFLSPGTFSKDMGWELYNSFWRVVFLDNADFYFLAHDIIYTLGFVYFAFKTFNRKYVWFYLLVSFISLGFYNGGTNIMRSGFAMSLIFYGLANFKNNLRGCLKLCAFCIGACAIHISTGLIVFALVISYIFPKWKWYIALWCCFVLLAWADALAPVANVISYALGDNAARIDNYMLDTHSISDLYEKTGFRIDFIIYSAVPIIFGIYYLQKF